MERFMGYEGFTGGAAEALARQGLILAPADFSDIQRITSRDTRGGSYPYNAGFSEIGLRRGNYVLRLGGAEVGFVYHGTKGDEGRLGMVHTAPALREHGLGSILVLVSCLMLVEDGAGYLTALVGDETGKMKALLEKIGFTYEGMGPFGQPRYRLELTQLLIDCMGEMLSLRLGTVKSKGLVFDEAGVDIDNPARESVEKVLAQRLEVGDDWFGGGEKVLYGYVGAEVLVYLQNYVDGTSRLFLRVKQGDSYDAAVRGSRLFEDFADLSGANYGEGISFEFSGKGRLVQMAREIGRLVDSKR